MNFNLNGDRKIVLKKGVNKGMVVVSLISVFVIIMILTSKIWLPDTKIKMERNNSTDVNYNSSVLKMDKEIYKDTNLNIGEVRFKIEKDISIGDDFEFKVMTENGEEFPKKGYKVIKSETLSAESESKGIQYFVLQFGLPKNFYYLKILVSQKGYKTEEFELDYRNFKEKKLSEKGDDYLIKLQPFLLKKAIQEEVVKSYKEEYKGVDKTLKKLKNEVKTLKAQVDMLNDDNVKKSKQVIIVEKEKSLKEYEVRYMNLDKKIEESELFLNKINDDMLRLE